MRYKKSKSCLDVESGELLIEFPTMSAARSEAAAQNMRPGCERVFATKCARCGAFHVRSTPEAFTESDAFERTLEIGYRSALAAYTARLSDSGCSCRGRDGTQKRLYSTLEEARRVAAHRPVCLRIYACPETEGYHLTSS